MSLKERNCASCRPSQRLGLGKFFEENKKKTSNVSVFIKVSDPLFMTLENFDSEVYIRAFDAAIAKARLSPMQH
jgi:hypothetical protein